MRALLPQGPPGAAAPQGRGRQSEGAPGFPGGRGQEPRRPARPAPGFLGEDVPATFPTNPWAKTTIPRKELLFPR